jgi:hypothetical protein
MLKPEDARKQLEQVEIKDWDKKRLAALGKQPARLAEIGRVLLGLSLEGKPYRDWRKRNSDREVAMARLAKLSEKDRAKLFEVLFPRLAPQLEAAWQLMARLPYEFSAYDRKAFRAPGDPAAYQTARWSWLDEMISELKGHDQDVTWVAAWAPHLGQGRGADAVGILLAAAIDAGGPVGEQVFEILRESASNQHDVGRMGRHVTRALLVASKPQSWEFMEKLLLAAQRQEGLRQVILESIDEAHPQAFRRMLRLILEQNLIRFSSVVRAADVWFGLQWDSLTPRVIKDTLELALKYLEDPSARQAALEREKGDALYLALWAIAMDDASQAIAPAVKLLADADVERRFVGTHFLGLLQLPAARKELVRCLDDVDLRIALQALEACEADDEEGDKPDLFEALERLVARMPEKSRQLEPLVWPWAAIHANREDVADRLVQHLGKRPASQLLPYLSKMGYSGKVWMIEKIKEMKTWDAPVREALFGLVGDGASWVRERALDVLQKCQVTEAEAQQMEVFLSRKNPDLRRGVLGLLGKQKLDAAMASVDRLLASKKAEQRLGALELMRQQVEAKRGVAGCRERAEKYRAERKNLSEMEQLQVEVILDIERIVPTLDDALGLMNPAERTPPVPPKRRSVAFMTPAAVACLKSLDQLIAANEDTPVKLPTWEGEREELLGNVGWRFPSPPADPKEFAEALLKLPLRELWEKWWQERPKAQRDADGMELIRAELWLRVDRDDLKNWRSWAGKSADKKAVVEALIGGQPAVDLKYDGVLRDVVLWLQRLHPSEKEIDCALDAAETVFALVPEKVVKQLPDPKKPDDFDDWRDFELIEKWKDVLDTRWHLTQAQWSQAQKVRLWQLLHWYDQPVPGVPRRRPDLEHVLAGFEVGAAGTADVMDELLGPRETHAYSGADFSSLRTLTPLEEPEVLQRLPQLKALVERCRDRILEIELDRGENHTPASDAARYLASLRGLDLLLKFLQRLGKKPLDRKHYYGRGRVTVLSRLIVITHPGLADTPEAFADQVKTAIKAGQLAEERLLELAFMAPQWVRHVEHYLQWPGLAEVVWWFYAQMSPHRTALPGMGDEEDEDLEETGAPGGKLSPWEKLLQERSTLTRQERIDGVVDVGWFHKVHDGVGPRRWQILAAASKFACSDNSHKKANLLADVLRGKANKRELIAGIRQRFFRENVRLLGLLPLAKGVAREGDLLQHFKVLQEYRRYARSLAPMSKEGALRAFEIGVQNLARTAEYPDPIRLEWAMEAKEIADLAKGPVAATVKDVTVTLKLDDQAQPQVTVQRGDRELKQVPADLRKHPKIAGITERKADLKRQASRIRQSLEGSMCKGDVFTGTELRHLFEHPVLVPMLERLLLLGEGIRGFPVSGGQGLMDHTGKVEPIKPAEKLRLAHAHDLLAGGDWPKWQAYCFQIERVQPFKQIFRELYLVTEQEKSDASISRRYAGHQVNPKQAMALFGSRAWSTQDGVSKTFFDVGLTAYVTFRSGVFTPLEMEGLTLEGLRFRKRNDWEPVPLPEVPPRVFSEVMRDLDLVVSVAHLGGVDPEASASTVEMRAALLRETCSLLKIGNYRLQSSHVLIDGQLSKYSVHLGSAVVHRQPGGSMCIVPVHAQQRGRIFLPFADDDPRTAEVISKVILLARDHEIQDPSILEQIR